MDQDALQKLYLTDSRFQWSNPIPFQPDFSQSILKRFRPVHHQQSSHFFELMSHDMLLDFSQCKMVLKGHIMFRNEAGEVIKPTKLDVDKVVKQEMLMVDSGRMHDIASVSHPLYVEKKGYVKRPVVSTGVAPAPIHLFPYALFKVRNASS